MREIAKEDSGFDHRAKDISELKLRGDTVPVSELLEICHGKRFSPTYYAVRAAVMLNDLPALEEMAFEGANLSEVVMVAQMQLLQMSQDVAVLRKFAEKPGTPCSGIPPCSASPN